MIIVTDIEWDTEGESAEECMLPSVVLVEGTPDEDWISVKLSDAFGFHHTGFNMAEVDETHKTHGGGGYFPDRLGFINFRFSDEERNLTC